MRIIKVAMFSLDDTTPFHIYKKVRLSKIGKYFKFIKQKMVFRVFQLSNPALTL